ncbi:MAG TPA: metallophosphoesterase [Roseiflexaceae bacterium]|nr:metallophosphoesterase [Roseiflexaceae bacterium]
MTPTPPAAPPMTRRRFLRLVGASALTTTGTMLLGTAYAKHVEPYRFDIHRMDLALPRLDPLFDGFTLLHLSDIHSDATFMTPQRFEQVLGQIGAQPDLIAVTGDFITNARTSNIEAVLPLLVQLRPREGVVAVLGNHDHWSGPALVRGALERHGIAELPYAVHTLRRGAAELHLAGIDDLWPNPRRITPLEQARPLIEELAGRIPSAGAAVLLAHEPDVADISAAFGRFSLQLSGHSHGGQVRLPGRGAIILPALGRKYDDGLYQIGDMQLYTSRGLGMVRPQVRLNCPPEVALITLRATPAGGAR